MFQRISDWLHARRQMKQRCLFRFWDGTRTRMADPYQVYCAIEVDPNVDLQQMGPALAAGREPETGLVMDAVCRAFGVQKWDEATKKGLTGWELLDLLTGLLRFMNELKKNTNDGQTSPPATEPPPSMEPVVPTGDVTTKSPSDLPSI